MQPREKRVDVGAVNGLMAVVIEGHLSDHVIKEPAEAQRQEDPDAVMQVIKSYLQSCAPGLLRRAADPARLPQRHRPCRFTDSQRPSSSCHDFTPPSSLPAIALAWMTCACSPGPSLLLSSRRATT
ncbi:hypothetical protein P3T32_004397 [Ralstonia sp. GP73]|uniref:Uncharacterized protein n=3 Tax=Ralstonia TaxID=48736 RepID=A0AAD2BP53_9RALS|nr:MULTISPECIES: hypothetical protein [Ralstonia]MDH6644524.1 hypothetical protein [Ralstonia sp. GP73]CAJ0714969.1 hypothetical protein LMG7143_03232 [Ralstonia sp. LMG 18095]CAJ0782276.1 hypothetical protein R77560_00884 [Ralstonia sp. LMG 18095]CAJ0795441.1 hypothetical protein LMG18095_02750 [Ralstonia sp. LMG 18095]CAJ0883873.1 hypothetical protein R6138_02886 [Ralstonia sp. LMG 18095]